MNAKPTQPQEGPAEEMQSWDLDHLRKKCSAAVFTEISTHRKEYSLIFSYLSIVEDIGTQEHGLEKLRALRAHASDKERALSSCRCCLPDIVDCPDWKEKIDSLVNMKNVAQLDKFGFLADDLRDMFEETDWKERIDYLSNETNMQRLRIFERWCQLPSVMQQTNWQEILDYFVDEQHIRDFEDIGLFEDDSLTKIAQKPNWREMLDYLTAPENAQRIQYLGLNAEGLSYVSGKKNWRGVIEYFTNPENVEKFKELGLDSGSLFHYAADELMQDVESDEA